MVEEVQNKTVKVAKPSIWMITTIVLAVALVASVIGGGISGGFLTNGNSVGNKTLAYINGNMMSEGVTAKFINITESSGLWLMAFDVGGQEYTTYITKDGRLLLPQAIPIEEVEATKSTGFDAPDAEKPVVQLFVMSFCPYGTEAEKAMIPVENILGDSATIEPHFIINVMNKTEAENVIKAMNIQYKANYTISDKILVVGDNYLQSLHGPSEAAEDMRQAIILKNYGQPKLWNYLSYVNANCSLVDIGTCWKSAASATGLISSAIESKMATDGIAAMIADEALTEQYSVQGSPTLIINGVEYSGGRTSEGYKSGICSGFSTEPAACSQALSDTASTASGNCG